MVIYEIYDEIIKYKIFHIQVVLPVGTILCQVVSLCQYVNNAV